MKIETVDLQQEIEDNKEKNRKRQREWFARVKENPEQLKRVRAYQQRDNAKRRAKDPYYFKRRIHANRARAIIEKEDKCLDCRQQFHPAIYHFHHRDKKDKHTEMAKLWKYSWDIIILELTKCDMLCANCHIMRHVNEGDIT